jgi:hypothetical protein
MGGINEDTSLVLHLLMVLFPYSKPVGPGA